MSGQARKCRTIAACAALYHAFNRGVQFLFATLLSFPQSGGFMSTSATSVDLKSCPLYINGKPVISRGPKDVQYNPATGEAVAEIPRSTPEEISAAVEAAAKAFPSWSKTPVIQRAKTLFK